MPVETWFLLFAKHTESYWVIYHSWSCVWRRRFILLTLIVVKSFQEVNLVFWLVQLIFKSTEEMVRVIEVCAYIDLQSL